MDIIRYGHNMTFGVLNPGDQIVIQEKIDGANASFLRDGQTIRSFSRNHELTGEGGLDGFKVWTQTLDVNKLLDGVIYFGEWTSSHKVKYPGYEKQFFLYDIYNTFTNEYVHWSMVHDESNRLNLNLVPVFYIGEYISFEHLQSFVGKTFLNGKLGDHVTGEGIVVKNVNYKARNGNQIFVKLVVDKFIEVQKQKPPRDPNRPLTIEAEWVNMCLTEARVEKMLYKLVDEEILNKVFGIEDMGTILKNLSTRIINDMLKEESDTLPNDYDEKEIGRTCGKKLPLIVKQILNKMNVDQLNEKVGAV